MEEGRKGHKGGKKSSALCNQASKHSPLSEKRPENTRGRHTELDGRQRNEETEEKDGSRCADGNTHEAGRLFSFRH